MRISAKRTNRIMGFICILLLMLPLAAFAQNKVVVIPLFEQGPAGGVIKYGKVALVAQSGGDYTNPATAMSDYATWCGTPSSSNPCLLKIMPGVYDVGSTPVVMRNYIDIEGSGQRTTTIKGAISTSSAPPSQGTIVGADYAEIRFLRVENRGSGTFTTAIVNSGSAGEGASLLNVSVFALAGTYRYGIYNMGSAAMKDVYAYAASGTYNYGIYNNAASPHMTNIEADVSGGSYAYGVYNYDSSPRMMNVTAQAMMSDHTRGVYNYDSNPTMTHVGAYANSGLDSYGVYNYGSSVAMIDVNAIGSTHGVMNRSSGMVKISQSVLSGSDVSIDNGAGVTTRVVYTQLSGPATINAGTLTCIGAYDENYAVLGTNCL